LKIRHVLRNEPDKTKSAPPAPFPAAGATTAAAPAREGLPAGLRILLVEDDALIRFSTLDMLESLGHSVTEAGTGGEALAAMEAERIDVLLTDVGLPDTSGVEVAMRARRMQPGLRVVFATGADAIPGLGGSGELAGAVLLSKPYDQKGLAKALKGSDRG
jgi:CheY-like chemotaxis protein